MSKHPQEVTVDERTKVGFGLVIGITSFLLGIIGVLLVYMLSEVKGSLDKLDRTIASTQTTLTNHESRISVSEVEIVNLKAAIK